MRPTPGQVLHFSEDPTITRFIPHVAATARQKDAYVWTVDAARSSDYWFPRACPRAMVWVTPDTTGTDRAHILGPGGGDLLALHEQAGIQLRILPDLWPFWNKVTTTTLGWSGIRLPNARPRP